MLMMMTRRCVIFDTVLGIAAQWMFTKLWLDLPRNEYHGLKHCFVTQTKKAMVRVMNKTFVCGWGLRRFYSAYDLSYCKYARRFYVDCQDEWKTCVNPHDVRTFSFICLIHKRCMEVVFEGYTVKESGDESPSARSRGVVVASVESPCSDKKAVLSRGVYPP